MPPVAHREEVVNSALAQSLRDLGVEARAETIVHTVSDKQYPDVVAEWAGLQIVIEGKFEGGGAAQEVSTQVEQRLDDALGDLGVALVYPDELRTSTNLPQDLPATPIQARFFAPGRSGQWQQIAGVEDLVRCFDWARGFLIDDDAVKSAAEGMANAVAMFERAAAAQPARRSSLLGVVSAADTTGAGGNDLESAQTAATSIAGLALVTAATLQNELCRIDEAVPQAPQVEEAELRDALIDSWNTILDHDYAAIFRVAKSVLETLENDPRLASALAVVEETAARIAASRALGRHDLIGRIYHTLLADRKYLATYFTSVPAATLLSGLALTPQSWPTVDWGRNPDEGAPLRVGDFACGTGTLLLAASAAIRRNWTSQRAQDREPLDVSALGKTMIEEGLQGYDVLAYALQICAATLLLGAPGVAVDRTALHRMPFGGTGGRLGSLELLTGTTEGQLWGEEVADSVSMEAGDTGLADVQVPELDLVIMNPPFTRSVGGSQLLGSLGDAPFATARQRLRDLCNRNDVSATLTAGLGAPFTELAVRAVKPGGRLALVLPKALLTGQAWAKTRELLASTFVVEFVVCSHEPGQWNFSDSTDLSEALVVLRRLEGAEFPDGQWTTWVALSENPDTAIEALGTLSAIVNAGEISREGTRLSVADTLDGEIGEAFIRPSPRNGDAWRHGTFSRSVLDQASEALLNQLPIPLPRTAEPFVIPTKRLEQMGTLGYDRRDITDAFDFTATAQGYPAIWGQDAETMNTLAGSPNRELAPRTEPAPGRDRIKPADQVWAGAGRLMIAERLWAVTYTTIGVALPDRAVSNTSWSVNLDGDDPENDKILALWLNSSLGILSFLGAAEETRGPWVAMKKNKLKKLPVLDPTALSEDSRGTLLEAWESLNERALLAISELGSDPIRTQIDEAISSALDLEPDALLGLRLVLGAESKFRPLPEVRAPRITVEDGQRQLF